MATAIKYRTSNQKLIQLSNGHEYVFTSSANISLAWVEDDDVPAVLAITHNCCGNNKKPAFFLANESDIRRWTNGGGR